MCHVGLVVSVVVAICMVAAVAVGTARQAVGRHRMVVVEKEEMCGAICANVF